MIEVWDTKALKQLLPLASGWVKNILNINNFPTDMTKKLNKAEPRNYYPDFKNGNTVSAGGFTIVAQPLYV